MDGVADSAAPRGARHQKDERQMSVTAGAKRKGGGFPETGRFIFPPLFIALFLLPFLSHPLNIPWGSMKAPLLVGDFFFVSKFSSAYTHFSLPFSPPLFPG